MKRNFVWQSVFLFTAAVLLVSWLGSYPPSLEAVADPRPQQECGECSLSGGGPPCVCVQYPMFFNGLYYFYYVHRHEDCENCALFDPAMYVTPNVIESQDCELGECPQVSPEFTDSAVHLEEPLPADFDLSTQQLPEAQCRIGGVVTGSVITPSGRRARVKVFQISCFDNMTRQHTSLSAGFEVVDDGTPDAFVATAQGLYENYRHIYEFSVEDQRCTFIGVE